VSALLAGDRVEVTGEGYGRVVSALRDWSMGECDAAWHHAAGGQPPMLITVTLDSGRTVARLPGDVRRLAQCGTCDP